MDCGSRSHDHSLCHDCLDSGIKCQVQQLKKATLDLFGHDTYVQTDGECMYSVVLKVLMCEFVLLMFSVLYNTNT